MVTISLHLKKMPRALYAIKIWLVNAILDVQRAKNLSILNV